MTKKVTNQYREQIKACVADGLSHSCFISDATNIPRAEVTRLLNQLATEPGSGVVKKTRGIYVWAGEIPKPVVVKEKSIVDWLRMPFAWSIRK